jgi:glucose/arabinose dehydrogenase
MDCTDALKIMSAPRSKVKDEIAAPSLLDDLFDCCFSVWPELYKPEEEATLPAEELMLLTSGSDYGWPEWYYDGAQKKLVLAPEYGGDGGKAIGVCASKTAPVAAFPAHWAPNGIVRCDEKGFPARYRDGVFIAFHGSWNRAPYPQGGYNVVFQPLEGDHASGIAESLPTALLDR